MIKSIRWATYAACCGVIAILVQDGSSTLAETPLPYASPLPCGGGCICIPNARHYGYFPTIWRQWPDEARPDINFPQSVGIETLPTPPGEEQLLPPIATPESFPAPEQGILPPGERFEFDQGTREAPVEPEVTPPAGIPLPGTLPGLPQTPSPVERGTELPGTLPGLPVDPDSISPPSDDRTLPEEIPAEEPVKKPFDDLLEGTSDDDPLEVAPDGTYRPYFAPQPPVSVPEEPTIPVQEVVETLPVQEATETLASEEVIAVPSGPPQKFAALAPSVGESDREAAPPARLSQDLSPAAEPLQVFVEESMASPLPLPARVNEPQSLAAPGEAIMEPLQEFAKKSIESPLPLPAAPGEAIVEPALPAAELPRQFAEESIVSPRPQQAVDIAPESLAAPGEAIVEPMLPAPPGEAIVEPTLPAAEPLQEFAEESMASPLPQQARANASQSLAPPGEAMVEPTFPVAEPLRQLAEESMASPRPLQARANAPQSLAAPGEAIVEPTLPAAPQQLHAEPLVQIEIRPASPPKVEPASPPESEPPRTNLTSALNSGLRTGGGRVTLVKDNSAPALDGYCPVNLVEEDRWTAGHSGLSAAHHGRTYFFSNSAAHQRFLADPNRYAPAYQGNDPVLLVEERRRVAGQTDYCMTCNGRLYAFSCEETLQQFLKSPQKYVAPRGK